MYTSLPLRHHSNPVGTAWKWKMDDPHMIVEGALENHYKMIKQFKGQSLIVHALTTNVG